MNYDEKLAVRLRKLLSTRDDLVERRQASHHGTP
jgi:hypothetical protein